MLNDKVFGLEKMEEIKKIVESIKKEALLALMVVDIQREYRFYPKKEEIRLQKNMDVRRKYVGIARRVRSTQNRPAASDLCG